MSTCLFLSSSVLSLIGFSLLVTKKKLIITKMMMTFFFVCVGCGCSWIQDNSMLHYSATSNWTSKKCSALPTTKTVDVSSVSDLFEFICSGPLVDKIGITPEKVGQAIDKWLLYGSQLCRLFQLNELKLTIPQKARLYHYYIPVFVWCQGQISLHSSKFNDGDDVPPLVVPIVIVFGYCS